MIGVMEQSVIISLSLPADLLVGLGHAAKAAGRTPADQMRALLRQAIAVPSPDAGAPLAARSSVPQPSNPPRHDDKALASSPNLPSPEPEAVTARVLAALRRTAAEPEIVETVTPSTVAALHDDPVLALVKAVCSEASAQVDLPQPPDPETPYMAATSPLRAEEGHPFSTMTYDILATQGDFASDTTCFQPEAGTNATVSAAIDADEHEDRRDDWCDSWGEPPHHAMSADLQHAVAAAPEHAWDLVPDNAMNPTAEFMQLRLPEAAFAYAPDFVAAPDLAPEAGFVPGSEQAVEPGMATYMHLQRIIKSSPGWLDLQRSLRREGLVLRLTDCGRSLVLHSWPEDRPLFQLEAIGLTLERLCLHFRAPFPGGGGLSHVLRALVSEGRGPGRAA